MDGRTANRPRIDLIVHVPFCPEDITDLTGGQYTRPFRDLSIMANGHGCKREQALVECPNSPC